MTIAIVGSGPSAVSAAFCLLRKGLSVTMLDVGYRLEPQRQQLVSRLAAATPQEWHGDSLEMLRKATSPDVKGLPKKLVYGSDYAYRAPGELVQIEERGVDLLVSHALGGLSNAWGANVLPFHDLDITDWPVRVADLAPYYRAVFSFVDLSAMEDRLISRFPLYTDSPRASAQAARPSSSLTILNLTVRLLPVLASNTATRGLQSAPSPRTATPDVCTAASVFMAAPTV